MEQSLLHSTWYSPGQLIFQGIQMCSVVHIEPDWLAVPSQGLVICEPRGIMFLLSYLGTLRWLLGPKASAIVVHCFWVTTFPSQHPFEPKSPTFLVDLVGSPSLPQNLVISSNPPLAYHLTQIGLQSTYWLCMNWPLIFLIVSDMYLIQGSCFVLLFPRFVFLTHN